MKTLKASDLSFLEGKEIIQICIGKYQIILNFTDDISIDIECEFSVLLNQEKYVWVSDTKDEIPFGSLIGIVVNSFDLDIQNNLVLTFSDDVLIEIIASSNDGFESYQVRNGETLMII